MWTPNQRCVGRAVRHDDILTAQGLKNVSLSVRTTNKRTQRQGQEANEELEMSCRTKRDFIAWAVLEELLLFNTGEIIQCQHESHHPIDKQKKYFKKWTVRHWIPEI